MSSELRNYLIAKLERTKNLFMESGMTLSEFWFRLDTMNDKELLEVYNGIFA